MTCRICLEDDDLISPCKCSGTAAYVHEECLVKWMNVSGRSDCEICKHEYVFEEVEERQCVVCPKWSLESPYTSFLFFFILFGAPWTCLLFGFNPEMSFFACNIVYLWLVLCHSKLENILQLSVFWKLSFGFGECVIAFMYKDWFFVYIEGISVLTLFICVYIHLVQIQSKQLVYYIYTEGAS